MKTLSPALYAHLQGDTTLATLVKITRSDGYILGLTSFDRDLEIDGVVYHADAGFIGSALTNQAGMKTDESPLTSVLDSPFMTAQDLAHGLYDHARIDVYMCNWKKPEDGLVQLRRGWFGDVSSSDARFTVDVRGLHDLLDRCVGDVYSPECRHAFCDGCCGLDATHFTYRGSVTSLVDDLSFKDSACQQAQNIFADGLLTWESGAHVGSSMEVRGWDASTKTMTLWMTLGGDIQVGDTFRVIQGCDKKFSTCCAVFNNALNFGGFPHLPGLTQILQYP